MSLESIAINVFGSVTTFSIVILVVLLVCFLMAGIDFRIASLLCMPAVIGLGEVGWLPQGVVGLAWMVIVGFGLYLMWNWIRER